MIDKKEALTGILADYFGINNPDGSYHYTLGRDKEAFAIGTMDLDGFRVYDEDTVDEIAAHLIQNGVTVNDMMDGVLVVNPTGREVDAILAEIEAGIMSVIPDTDAIGQGGPQTNADRIRSMNDEDLAETLVAWLDDWCEYEYPDGKRFLKQGDAVTHTLEWLKRPAQEV